MIDVATLDRQKESTNASSFTNIEDYYRETIEDYQLWSPSGYMHFGMWDRWLNPFNRESMLERMNEYLFGLLQIDDLEDSRIGDFGCGLGAVSRYGARKYPQHTWIGVTISQEQATWCAQNSPGLMRKQPAGVDRPLHFQDENLEIWCADYHQTPFDNESLGGVFFLESVCHSSNLEQVLNEVYRVLKPGSRAVIVDGLLKKAESLLPRHARWLIRETCRNWAVPRFHSLEEVRAQADNSGFKVLETKDISWSIVPSVLHSPCLIAWRALILSARKLFSRKCPPTVWQWRHLRACLLGMFLGFHRRSFGYYSVVLEKL